MDTSIENLQHEIEEIMLKIQHQMDDREWQELNNLIIKISTMTLTSLAEYEALKTGFNVVQSSFHRIRFELDIMMSEFDILSDDGENELQLHYESIGLLQTYCAMIEKRRSMEYVQHLLVNELDLRSVLFGDVNETESGINQRYRKLAKLFHPDRTNQMSIFTDLFQKIAQEKEKILKELQVGILDWGRSKFHEQEGDNRRDMAQDYENAKNPCYSFTVLNREDFRNMTKETLENYRNENAILAFQHFREAMIALGKKPDLDDLIRLRKKIVESLLLAGQNHIIEAEMYTSGTIYIITTHTDRSSYTCYLYLREMSELLIKIREKTQQNQSEDDSEGTRTENNRDILPTEWMKISNDAINSLHECLLLRGDSRIAKPETPPEWIEALKLESRKNRAKGIGLIAFGAVSASALIEIVEVSGMVIAALTTSAVISASIILPVFIVVQGAIGLIFGVTFGTKLYKKGRAMMHEPEIRKNLNNIMKDAIDYIGQEDYENFFSTLARPYFIRPQTSNKVWRYIKNLFEAEFDENPLIKYEAKKILEINPDHIVQQLLKHEVRPDGIAYLMNIIGEALIRLKINEEEDAYTHQDLVAQAIHIYRAVFNEDIQENLLKKKAMELDEAVEKSKSKQKHTNMFKNLISKFDSKIPEEYIEAAKQAKFMARYEEMANIAKINCATGYLLQSSPEHAKRILKDVKHSWGKNYQFLGNPEMRLEALKDWLFAIGIHDENDYEGPDLILYLKE